MVRWRIVKRKKIIPNAGILCQNYSKIHNFFKKQTKYEYSSVCIQYKLSKYFRREVVVFCRAILLSENIFYYAVFMMLEMRCYAQASRSR